MYSSWHPASYLGSGRWREGAPSKGRGPAESQAGEESGSPGRELRGWGGERRVGLHPRDFKRPAEGGLARESHARGAVCSGPEKKRPGRVQPEPNADPPPGSEALRAREARLTPLETRFGDLQVRRDPGLRGRRAVRGDARARTTKAKSRRPGVTFPCAGRFRVREERRVRGAARGAGLGRPGRRGQWEVTRAAPTPGAPAAGGGGRGQGEGARGGGWGPAEEAGEGLREDAVAPPAARRGVDLGRVERAPGRAARVSAGTVSAWTLAPVHLAPSLYFLSPEPVRFPL